MRNAGRVQGFAAPLAVALSLATAGAAGAQTVGAADAQTAPAAAERPVSSVEGDRPAAAVSEEPLVTDRPDFTESAVTVAPGRVQLETGYTVTRVAGQSEHSFGELLVRIGVLERLEARVGINSFVWTAVQGDDPEGFQDVSLGGKVNLLRSGESRWRPDVGVLLAASIPTGASDVDEGHAVQPVGVLAAGVALTDWLSTGANVSWGYLVDGDERYSQFAGSLAFGLAATDALGFYAEYFGFFPELRAGPNAHFLDGGITYRFTPNLQVDGRGGFSLGGAETDSFLGLGLAVRI